MAWRRPGDKPYLNQWWYSLLTHICVTRPQWFDAISNVAILVRNCNSDQYMYLNRHLRTCNTLKPREWLMKCLYGFKMANCSIVLLPIRLSDFRAIFMFQSQILRLDNFAKSLIGLQESISCTPISVRHFVCMEFNARVRVCLDMFTTQYSARHQLSHTCTHQLPLRFLSAEELAGNWPTLEVHILLVRSRKNSVPSTKTLLHVFKKH